MEVKREIETTMSSIWTKGDQKFFLTSKTVFHDHGIKPVTLWKIDGWNPLPVKGWFESSYPILSKWLKKNGWNNLSDQSYPFTVINHTIETVVEDNEVSIILSADYIHK